METRGRVPLADDTDLALETSLVEWKLFSPSCGLWPLKTLETSLVEWKLRDRHRLAEPLRPPWKLP